MTAEAPRFAALPFLIRASLFWETSISQGLCFGALQGGAKLLAEQPGAPWRWRFILCTRQDAELKLALQTESFAHCSTASSEGKAASSSSFLPEPAALGGLCHWLQVLCAAGGISSGNRGTEGSFWREFDHKFNIKHKLLFEQAKLERSHRMHSAAPVQSWLILSPKWGWSSGAFVGEHSLLPSRCNLKRSEGEMADVWRAYVQGRSVLFRCPGIFVFWNVFLRSSSHKRKSKALPNNMLFDFTSNL